MSRLTDSFAQADEPFVPVKAPRDEFVCPGTYAERLDERTVQGLKTNLGPAIHLHALSAIEGTTTSGPRTPIVVMHPAIPVTAHIHATYRLTGTLGRHTPGTMPRHHRCILASAAIKSSAFIAAP